MGEIITFYSYKGGVGRTFALANIGVYLARQGHRILMMDWDLEAPGLERFFDTFDSWTEFEKETGILPLLEECRERADANWRHHIKSVELPGDVHLDMIPSGAHVKEYAARLQAFPWAGFFGEEQRGRILERIRSEWTSEYDFILVDSRTGVTEIGGICTIFLADIIAAVFTAGEQSLSGLINVLESARLQRRHSKPARAEPAILPILSRFDGATEIDLSRKWLKKCAKVFQPYLDMWLEEDAADSAYRFLEATRIPHVAQYTFGEPLVVLTNTTSPDLAGRYLAMHARLLENSLRNSDQVVNLSGGPALEEVQEPSNLNPEPRVFISWTWDTGETPEWVDRFARDLAGRGFAIAGHHRYLALDEQDAPMALNAAITSADWILCVCTSRYAKNAEDPNSGVAREVELIAQLSGDFRRDQKVIPLLLPGGRLPVFLRGKRARDFRGDSKFQEVAFRNLVHQLKGSSDSEAESVALVELRTGLILVADVVGFSRYGSRMASDATEIWGWLGQIRALLPVPWSEVSATLDGACLIWDKLDAFESVLQAALNLIEHAASRGPSFELRICLHHGAYSTRKQPFAAGKILSGGGLNEASKIAALGDKGQLLLSETFVRESIEFNPNLLGSRIYPSLSQWGLEAFPSRSTAERVRLFVGANTNSRLPQSLFLMNSARRQLGVALEDLAQALALLLDERFGVAEEKSRPQVTLWLHNPLENGQLLASTFRYRWEESDLQGRDYIPLWSGMAQYVEGEGIVAGSFRMKGTPFVINRLPDPEREHSGYLDRLKGLGLSELMLDLTRTARTFLCCGFPLLEESSAPQGVVVIDLVDPCEKVSPEDLEELLMDVMQLVEGQIILGLGVLAG